MTEPDHLPGMLVLRAHEACPMNLSHKNVLQAEAEVGQQCQEDSGVLRTDLGI